jgi:arsenate reductase
VKKYRILFVCVGNACRSQMAEGFARQYGGDIVEVMSAGVYPGIMTLPPLTVTTMREKRIDVTSQSPKGLEAVPLETFDVVVNMSGLPVDGARPERVVEWRVRDPYGQSEDAYRTVRDQIEGLVMTLLIELRKRRDAELMPRLAAGPPRPKPATGVQSPPRVPAGGNPKKWKPPVS